MKIYIDENERYQDMKSTGYSFTFVSIIGLIALALIWLDILPINIDTVNKIMISIVMGILFIVFLIVGLRSFFSLGKIKNNIDSQKNNQNEIYDWYHENKNDFFTDIEFDSDLTTEEIYLQKYDIIFAAISNNFPKLKEEEVDHITEEILSKNNDENATA